jgi:hypothetical protein
MVTVTEIFQGSKIMLLCAPRTEEGQMEAAQEYGKYQAEFLEGFLLVITATTD